MRSSLAGGVLMRNDSRSDVNSDEPERHDHERSANGASKSPNHEDRTRWRRRFAAAAPLVCCALLTLLAVTVNCPFRCTLTGRVSNAADNPVDFDPVISSSGPVMAGWPYRFSIDYVDGTISRFSWLAMLYDVGLSIIVIAAGTCYVYFRSLRGFSARRFAIADVLVVTSLLAVPAATWHYKTKQYDADQDLAERIRGAGGKVTMQAVVPQLLASRLPKRIKSILPRIVAVQLDNPSEELVVEIVNQRQLAQLRLGGGQYDLRLLDRLASSSHLEELRIAGRVIDARVLQLIATLPRLHSLTLAHTNVDTEGLTLLSDLTSLRRLNLDRTDVDTSRIGKPQWSQTLEELHLPQPDPGNQASVQISKWPSLKRLVINDLDSQANVAPMTVKLEDLPNLETIELSVFQKFDLQLRDLPVLHAIKPIAFEWQTRLPHQGTLPAGLWFSRLDVDQTPSIERLGFYTLDLEHLNLQNVPKLKTINVSASFLTVNQNRDAKELPPEVSKVLIEGLGSAGDLQTVDLDRVPLGNVDLSPLTKNKSLKRIQLAESVTTLRDWKTLAGHQRLMSLDISGNALNAAGLAWILDAFPELEELKCTLDFSLTSEPPSLRLVNLANLRRLDFGESQAEFLSRIDVVDSPKVDLELRLGFVQELNLVNAPSLKGVSVSTPFPTQHHLEGLRDLTFFAAGGSDLDDGVLEAIAPCQHLARLTLAYPAVTPDGLEQLTHFDELIGLHVPGSAINDDVIGSWPDLPRLSELDVSDTEVSGEGLRKLISNRTLTWLAMNHSQIVRQDTTMLAGQTDLVELFVAGIGIDPETLNAIMDAGSLERLDLSDTTVDSTLMDVLLTHGGSLQHLMLRNSEFDSPKLASLARQYPNLKVDLEGSNVATELMSALISNRRIVETGQWYEHVSMEQMRKWYEQQENNGRVLVEEFQRDPELYPALINVNHFADNENPGPTVIFAAPSQDASPAPLGADETTESPSGDRDEAGSQKSNPSSKAL